MLPSADHSQGSARPEMHARPMLDRERGLAPLLLQTGTAAAPQPTWLNALLVSRAAQLLMFAIFFRVKFRLFAQASTSMHF